MCASVIVASAVSKLPCAVAELQAASALQGGKAASKVGQGYKFSSVGSRFKKQLQELMDALHQMEPHYIRCIKPNSHNRSALAARAHMVPSSTACCSSHPAGWPALLAPASSCFNVACPPLYISIHICRISVLHQHCFQVATSAQHQQSNT